MKLPKIILSGLILLLSLPVCGQRKADVTVTYDQNIENILLNPATGQIIVKEKDAISCYNPETGKSDWKVTKEDIGKMSTLVSAQKITDALNSPDMLKVFGSTDMIEFIPDSPFIRGVVGDKDVIINAITGQVVFNSGQRNYRIVKSEFIPQDNDLLLIATNGKVFSCVLCDLDSGTDKWSTEIASVDGYMKQLSSALLFKSGPKAQDQLVSKDKYIYACINARLYKLDKTDGKIKWNTDFQLTGFYPSESGKNIIIIKSTGGLLSNKQALNILSDETGKPIWADDIKTSYISYIEDWNDRVLVAHSSGFNFYYYADGKKVWKKDAKGDNIKRVIPIDRDYLYVADNEMNLIDANGVSKWKKPVEISDKKDDPIYCLDKVDNNRVFYLTSTYGNMVDYTSGKKIWKKNIEFNKNRPLLYAYDETAKTFLVYNDDKIYKFDPNSKDKPEPIAKIKNIKDDKTISSIELFSWGICLTGQSDIIGVKFDGTTLYHHTYKEPGGDMRKTLKVVGTGAAIWGSSIAALAHKEVVCSWRDDNGQLHESRSKFLSESAQKQAAAIGAASSAITGTLLPRVAKRFNALQQNNNYAFIFAKSESDGSPVLVKVRKEDGVEVDKIAIDNTKPIYEIDPVTDDVFYVYKNELRIYSEK